MNISPLTKVALGIAAVPTAVASGSIGMSASILPSKYKVNETNQIMVNLEDGLGERMGEMITQTIQTSVNQIKEELAFLTQKMIRTSNSFNLQLDKESKSLISQLERIKKELISNVSSTETNTESQLQNVSELLQSMENNLKSQLNQESSSLETSLNALKSLSTVVKRGVKKYQSSYTQVINQMTEDITKLSGDLNPDRKTYSCTVKLNKVRTKFSQRSTDPKTAIAWSLSDFLNIIKGQEIAKRPVGYNGRILSARELEREIKAKCLEGRSEILVNKLFSFYQLAK